MSQSEASTPSIGVRVFRVTKLFTKNGELEISSAYFRKLSIVDWTRCWEVLLGEIRTGFGVARLQAGNAEEGFVLGLKILQ